MIAGTSVARARDGVGNYLSALSNYILIAKPGIVLGNLVSLAGGFFLASKSDIDLMLLFYTAIGVCLVIASGCIFNNIIDRDIDQLMARTRSRVLVSGVMPLNVSFIYATALGLTGIIVLLIKTNPITVGVALAGFIIYVGVYSLYLKRNSVHGTLVGSLAGATPPVAGYCAVSQEFDTGAALLLLLFSIWQMPHAFAIAIFRLNDYQAAAIPVLPVKRGIGKTKSQIFIYILGFILVTPLLTLTGYTGRWYLVITSLLGCYWLYMAWHGFNAQDDQAWAKKLFLFSIVTVIVLSLMMSLDATG